MLSKQDKLKYGQMLRLQMKEKQDKKRMQQLEKRAGSIKKSPTDVHLHVENAYNPNTVIPQNNNYQPTYNNNNNLQVIDQKQLLQKKLENQDYMPFGRPGAGAPSNNNQNYNQRQRINSKNNSSNPNLYNPVYAQMQAQQMNSYNRREIPQNYNETYNQNLNHISTFDQIQQQQQKYQNYQGGYQPVQQLPPPNYDLNGKYQPSQYYNQNTQSVQQNYGNNQLQYQSQQPQQNYQNQVVSRFQSSNNPYQNPPQQRQWDQFNNSRPPADLYQKPMEQIIRYQQTNRQKTMENQEMMELYRKGGRNLLKLQNQTAQQLSVKQKQKIQMQKYLKLQIEQAQKKKKEQKQRLKQQELQQQRRNQEYLQKQNQKIKDDQRKQQQKKRKLQQQNQKNLQMKKQMQQEARRAAEAKQNKAQNQSIHVKNNQKHQQQFVQQPAQVFSRNIHHKNIVQDQSSSVSSNSIMIQQAFNTDVSKQFFRRERQRDPQKHKQDKKIQVFTQQLQKMRDQITNQGALFEKEITKVKLQAERAIQQKRRADQEAQRLRKQLKKKMQDDNQKLFQALNRNNKQSYDSPPQQYRKKGNSHKQQNYYEHDSRDKPLSPLKPKKGQKLVAKMYQPPTQQQLQQTNNFDNGLQSLVGDSKKIPLNLKANHDLSMSQLSDFARQTGFFKQKKIQNIPPKKSYAKNIKQSIAEQDQDRMGSRSGSRQSQKPNYNNYSNNYNNSNQYNKNQNKDQLDRLVDSRQKSRGGWGQLSSVNSDITKQIQDLLKKKGNPTYQKPQQRPGSKRLQSAGKQSISNYNNNYNNGISYQGGTLNSNGTFDIDRIYNRNDERLRQLKKLGVQTVNTNDDGQLDRLDVLLKKYAN